MSHKNLISKPIQFLTLYKYEHIFVLLYLKQLKLMNK
jgi:hypothetical protein